MLTKYAMMSNDDENMRYNRCITASKGLPYLITMLMCGIIYLLTDWLIDWLIDWLTYWLIDWLIDWSIDWLIDSLIDWLDDWLIDWFDCLQVDGPGLTLKRNQAYVMKYIMQDYQKLAYVLDQPREYREKMLAQREETQQLKYLINLIDLLATCAEVSDGWRLEVKGTGR